ncbi:hypothetical protein WA171_002437 [Blastocystis sp. BT1]
MIFGLVNIFNGDERLSMIVQYNEFAILWNETLRFDFEKAALVPQINGNTTNLTKNTTASGLYYPYRDSCSRKNDPICVQVPAFYWSTVFPLRILSNVTINITDFSETIPVKRVWELEKSAIHCEGGSQTTCHNLCRKAGGRWDMTRYVCVVEGFLSRICLRFVDLGNQKWSIDSPPRLPLYGTNPGRGCEATVPSPYVNYDVGSWKPFLYSTMNSSSVLIELRHYGDAYVRASSITKGCSSSTEVNQSCFGKSKEDSLGVTILSLVTGICLSVITFIVYLRKRMKNASGFLMRGNDCASVDLPLEEKSVSLVEQIGLETPITPMKGSNTEEELGTAIQLLNEVETENMHIAQFHEKRDSESPYLDNDYEGYEDGI